MRARLVFLYLVFITVLFALSATLCVRAAENITVVIDPGHGGVSEDGSETNSGCKYHGLEEKNVNLITAQALYDKLTQYGNVSVYLTRDNDTETTLDQRIEFAKSVNADVVVSVHYNASAEHNFFGSEIFTSAYGKCYGIGHALAEHIMDEWTSEGNIRKDIKTRIGKKGDYYGLIRKGTEAGIPVIILEHGYLDNDRDYQRIRTEDAWKNFGVLDADGIAKFYGLEKDVVREKVGPVDEISDPSDPVMPDSTEPTGVRLEIDEYNSNKGDVKFTLYAYDDESKLMYYGFETGDVDKDTVFSELELWEGKNGKMTGSFHVHPGYEGKLTAKVYNVYQLDSLSNTVTLEPDEEAPDDEEDNAVVNDDGEDAGISAPNEDLTEAEAAAEPDWVIGGDLPKVDTSAIANAIDKNTESKVKKSYTGLIIAGLVGAITIAVSIVIGISYASDKRRRSGKKREDK
ncbi:MAG: N-acetylmuramoyl-L-alanine amidase [Lachnospiraceae bacterium]|nr:N-acetylmuramoyl-L-alanine amidase [Lachnospiraceae bacterium]